MRSQQTVEVNTYHAYHVMNIHDKKYLIPLILTLFFIALISPVVAADTSDGHFVDRAASDDGALTIKSTENNTIFLFQHETPLWSYHIPEKIWTAAISPEGNYIAIGSEGGLIWLFNQNGALVWNKSFGNGAIRSIEFSQDSQYLDASNFMNQAFFLSLDGNPATRPSARTATEIPTGTAAITQGQNPANPDVSWIVSFLSNNLNLLIGVVALLCITGITWYAISQRGRGKKARSVSVPDFVTLKNFAFFPLALILVSFVPDYYQLGEYAGFFRAMFGWGILCFILAFFLYALKVWGTANRIGAVLMVATPIFAYTLATSEIPQSTSNIFVYVGIQFCLLALFSAIVLFVSDTVKTGLDGIIRAKHSSRYFRPDATYALCGLVIVSIIAVNAGSVGILSNNLNSMTGSIHSTSPELFPQSNAQDPPPKITYLGSQTVPTTGPDFITEIQKVVSKPEPAIDIPSLERRIHELINQQRTSNGLSALSYDSSLTLIARKHSEDMAKNNYFSHVNLQGYDPSVRGTQAGYSCNKNYGSYYTTGLGENIFQTHRSTTYSGITVNELESSEAIAQETVEGWMNSPGHRQNILKSTYDREGIGVGVSSDKTVYVTEDFC